MAERLIIGCGYVGSRAAQAWIEQGDRVWGTTRSSDGAIKLKELGVRPIVWDWHAPSNSDSPFQKRDFHTVLVAVSHGSIEGIPDSLNHVLGLENLRRWIPATKSAPALDDGSIPHAGTPRWIYLSTCGVMEDPSDGAWVDESARLTPERPGAIAAAAAEEWLERTFSLSIGHTQGTNRKVVILRPAGIYGPGRIPNWQSVKEGTPLKVAAESYLNLIHVDDLVETIIQFADSKPKFGLYCVSDNQPTLRCDYYRWISELGKFPQPIFAEDPNSISPRSKKNRRVSSRRLLAEIDSPLKYPSYREGLKELLEQAFTAPN